MHGSRRVITFCLLTAVLPTILIVTPLYLRHVKYADVMYKISDSDVIQIHKGQSAIFCEKHSLKMNTSFNAFQMKGTPKLSDRKKHVRLNKSMTLPDDKLEYWGFFLLKGATVELKGCSRYEGSKILVVKGDGILDTCGILDGFKQKKDPPLIENRGRVLVTLENPENEKENIQISLNDSLSIEQYYTYTFSAEVQNNTKSIPNDSKYQREKRDIKLHNPNTVLDTGVHHGGNAFNQTEQQDVSISSFEVNLHECFHDSILLNNILPFSLQCKSYNYLEQTTTLKVNHEVLVDGYYYYIFYSDNDFVINDIHAIFDIYKPTFQYVNDSNSKVCINNTECEFNVSMFSDELVIVEVPTKDGLTSNDETNILISKCHPRMPVYIFFPVSVLLLILLFSFL